MVKKLFEKGKRIFVSPQKSVLSAATIIMFMVVASRVLGLVRQRILAHYFVPSDLSLFFAAFRLPDLVFEVLVFGSFSSAFIPVFTKLAKKDESKAWETASYIVNIGVILFVIVTLILIFKADFLYNYLTPGFSDVEREKIVSLAEMLFAAQGFFVVSYVLTGVLESLRRFLIPALAPLFYNLGIIFGTLLLSERFGLKAPAYGVVLGAFCHFAIQLPLAVKLGFRLKASIKLTENVKKIGKLALPRVIEVSFMQILKSAELFFSSIISTASYTYYMFGNSLQLLPVGLFGTSIAKAALPSLSSKSDDPVEFRKTFFTALYDMSFFIIPVSTVLIVLRVPIIRLVYGTDIFSWEATVQTGYVLTAFAVGIFFQAAASLLARSFYALHDTRTPVIVSIFTILITILFDLVFVNVLGFGVWSLAAAFTIGVLFQAFILFIIFNKKIENGSLFFASLPIIKAAIASVGSGFLMFFMLKFFDRSVWVKRLSFLGKIDVPKNIDFERFVLDTRYTFNLLILTVAVSAVGGLFYILISILLRSDQVYNFLYLVRRVVVKRKVLPISKKEQEPLTPIASD